MSIDYNILCSFFLIGDVYNITHYLSFHPGGHNELMKAAGTDCTLLFNEVTNYHGYAITDVL